MNIIKVLDAINVSRPVANHLFGESHTIIHRMTIGWGVVMVGVVIAAVGHINTLHFLIAYVLDGVGYLIHGIGAVPTIEYVACKVKEQEVKQKEKKELNKSSSKINAN